MIKCPSCKSTVVWNVRGDVNAGDRRLRRSPGGNPYQAWVSHWACLDCGNRFEMAKHILWDKDASVVKHG